MSLRPFHLLLPVLLWGSPLLAEPLPPDALQLRLGLGYAALQGSASAYAQPGHQFRGDTWEHLFAEGRGFLASGVGGFFQLQRQSISLQSTTGAGEVGAWELLKARLGVAARAPVGPLLTEAGVGYGYSLEPVPGLDDGPQRTAQLHSVLLSLRGRVELPAQFQLELGALVPVTLHSSGPRDVPLDGYAHELEVGLSRRIGTVSEFAYGLRLGGRQRRFTARGAQGQSSASIESSLTLALELAWHPQPEVEEEAW